MTYNTKQKDMILDIIKKKKSSFLIKEIYDEMNEEVGLTTIYRFIDKLVNDGRISKMIGEDNLTYYQYLEECNHKNHFYLRCDVCGRLEHVDCDCIEELKKHIFNHHKFSMGMENIIINGLCNKCGGRL